MRRERKLEYRDNQNNTNNLNEENIKVLNQVLSIIGLQCSLE